jgi:hypothetical protein
MTYGCLFELYWKQNIFWFKVYCEAKQWSRKISMTLYRSLHKVEMTHGCLFEWNREISMNLYRSLHKVEMTYGCLFEWNREISMNLYRSLHRVEMTYGCLFKWNREISMTLYRSLHRVEMTYGCLFELYWNQNIFWFKVYCVAKQWRDLVSWLINIRFYEKRRKT